MIFRVEKGGVLGWTPSTTNVNSIVGIEEHNKLIQKYYDRDKVVKHGNIYIIITIPDKKIPIIPLLLTSYTINKNPTDSSSDP